MRPVVVIGLGRECCGDDAVGLRAVVRWTEKFIQGVDRPNVLAVQLETCGPELLAALQGSQAAVLVDAVRGAGPVGSLHLSDTSDLGAFNVGSASAHGWRVAETLSLSRSIDRESLPPRMIVLGVEVEGVAAGSDLSGAARVLDPAAVLIECLVRAALAEEPDRRLVAPSN